jgi:hypothetical protein
VISSRPRHACRNPLERRERRNGLKVLDGLVKRRHALLRLHGHLARRQPHDLPVKVRPHGQEVLGQLLWLRPSKVELLEDGPLKRAEAICVGRRSRASHRERALVAVNSGVFRASSERCIQFYRCIFRIMCLPHQTQTRRLIEFGNSAGTPFDETQGVSPIALERNVHDANHRSVSWTLHWHDPAMTINCTNLIPTAIHLLETDAAFALRIQTSEPVLVGIALSSNDGAVSRASITRHRERERSDGLQTEACASVLGPYIFEQYTESNPNQVQRSRRDGASSTESTVEFDPRERDHSDSGLSVPDTFAMVCAPYSLVEQRPEPPEPPRRAAKMQRRGGRDDL